MSWFFIALFGPFFWAISNIIDSYLVTKYRERERERSSGGLVLFTSLMGIIIAFIIGILTPGIFNILFWDKILLIVAGFCSVIWIIFYLYALEIEDISVVTPWFLTIPIFGYLFGYIFLGENLNSHQIIGSLIIFIGLFIMNMNFNKEKKKVNKKMIFYMIIVAIVVAISGVIFKYITVGGNFWVSSFWEYIGLGILGLFIYLFIPKYRNEFKYMNKLGGRKIFFLNMINEVMAILGNLLTNYALLLAPIAMVYLVGSFQPAIVLIFTILTTKFLPHILKEDISRRIIIPKIIAITIMIIGSIFLFV